MIKNVFKTVGYLIVIFAIIFVSGYLAIRYEHNDAYREMATGAFAGAFIGLILILYEQFREDIRDEKQNQRDRIHEENLRDDANRDADKRALANRTHEKNLRDDASLDEDKRALANQILYVIRPACIKCFQNPTDHASQQLLIDAHIPLIHHLAVRVEHDTETETAIEMILDSLWRLEKDLVKKSETMNSAHHLMPYEMSGIFGQEIERILNDPKKRLEKLIGYSESLLKSTNVD